MDTAIVPFPNPANCQAAPTLLWPRHIDRDEPNCYCLLIEGGHYSFSHCVEQCETDYEVVLLSKSVAFRNINGSFVVHFLCNENPCDSKDCLVETFLSSYMLITTNRKLLAYS